VDSVVLKEAQVQSYSPGGTNMCSPMWAHWCHLANTIEPSVCGGDAVLCQITLTTCYYSARRLILLLPLDHCDLH